MKVRYGNYRKNGVDMTGKVVDMDGDEARVLIESNIVRPVEEIEEKAETAALTPPENAMKPHPRPQKKTR